MSGFVCHLERAETGGLAGARLVGPGFDRAWTAPPLADDGGGGAGASAGGAGAAVRAAAAWVAEQLGSATRILELVTVDVAGGICSWISAPSAEPAVVTAAIRQHAGSTSPLKEAILSPARSTQALAAPGGGADRATTRYPVLSLPDAPVRVFLDELDRRGIEVRAVESLWHALAAAWDPAAERAGSRRGREPGSDRVVAGDGPATAIVMLDPGHDSDGRLVWAWSRQGALLAAGSMRLATVVPPRRPEVPLREALRETGAEEPTAVVDLARRVGGEAREEPAPAALACAEPETGRLALDWLAFAAQTGVNPERIIAFGAPVAAGQNGHAGGGQIGSIAHALGRVWPGATVDAATDEDPIGSTLRRLSSEAASPEAMHADPRAALASLTLRPGRLDRRVFRWTAAAILAASLGVALLGWQLGRAAAETRGQIDVAKGQQAELLTSLTTDFPDLNAQKITRSGNPEGELAQALATLRANSKEDAAPKPIVAELMNILKAIEPYADTVKVQKIDINLFAAVRLTLPEAETEAGPKILGELRDRSTMLEWQGQFVSGGRGQEGRPYVLTGQWRTPAPEGGAK